MKTERMAMASRQIGARRANRGFTLIELMIVVAIVAILAAVAYPSYIDSVRAARRADAMDALLTLQNLQEKWRASNIAYGTLGNIGGEATSADGYYNLSVADNTATAYTLTATAPPGSLQYSDSDCRSLTLSIDAGPGLKEPSACWKK